MSLPTDLPTPTDAPLVSASEDRSRDERRRATRALLRQPLLGAQGRGRELFLAVRKHETEIGRFFREWLGYRLVVEDDFARLHKRSPPGGLPRPLRSRSGKAFDRRRYALLCLVLAALERVESQTVLSQLAAEVQSLAATLDGVAPFEAEQHAERRAFVDAVRVLVDHGVLREADGQDTAYLEGGGDALYDLDARRLAQWLASPLPPSLVEGPSRLGEEVYPPTRDGVNLRLRHRLTRRLVEEPVLDMEALDAAELEYLTKQRPHLAQRVEDAVGLPVEVRREGLVLVDVEGETSDVAFPRDGSACRAAFLVIEEMLARRAATGEESAPWGALLGAAEGWLRGARWPKVYREADDGARALVDDAVELLELFGLVERRAEGLTARPAMARYRLATTDASPKRKDPERKEPRS